MYIPHNILPIKTDKKSLLALNNKSGELFFIKETETLPNDSVYINLYIINNIKIDEMQDVLKIPCIFISSNNMIITLAGKGVGLVKTTGEYYSIIATTDLSLEIRYDDRFSNVYVGGKSLNKKFSQIPFSFLLTFIKQFNSNNIIDVVELEYTIDGVVINENNEVSIKSPKKHIILQFVEELQNEFKDNPEVNLEYLTFAAERFISNLPE